MSTYTIAVPFDSDTASASLGDVLREIIDQHDARSVLEDYTFVPPNPVDPSLPPSGLRIFQVLLTFARIATTSVASLPQPSPTDTSLVAAPPTQPQTISPQANPTGAQT